MKPLHYGNFLHINAIDNSYLIKNDNGKVIVICGGVKEEKEYLRGFIGVLGNIVVDCWFISHPHSDNIGDSYVYWKIP